MMVEKSENFLKERTSTNDIKEDLDKFVTEIRKKFNKMFPPNNEISTQTNEVDLEEGNNDELNEEYKNKLLGESSSSITTSDEELYTSDDSRHITRKRKRRRRQKIKHGLLVNGDNKSDDNMDISISNDLEAVSEINEEKTEDNVAENSDVVAKEDDAKAEKEEDPEDKEIARYV